MKKIIDIKIKTLEQRLENQSKLIEAYAEEIERLKDYCNYLAQHLDVTISYSEYIAAHVENVYSHLPEIEPRLNFKDLFYGL